MAINQISDQNLGKFLQIVFSNGVRNQISEDYRDWEYIKRLRQGDPNGREQRFFFQGSYGPSAIQWAGISPAGSYPSPQQVSVAEHTALYKELNATIELEYNLWNRARKSPAKYAEPLAIEIQSKAMSGKRRLSADLYGDGTGALGEISSLSIDNGNARVVLKSGDSDRGHVGWFEFDDILVGFQRDGATPSGAPTVASGTFAYWKVEDKNRIADSVDLGAYDASGAKLTVTAVGLSANEVLYRSGQPTLTDLDAITEDYNQLTEVWAGLESLTASDGRSVHGITMSGSNKGGRYSGSGDPLDSTMIQRSLSQTKTTVGQGRYSYKEMCMAPEANDVLIESRETDRRFNAMQDATKGTVSFKYQHDNDALEVVVSEFCPKNRIYMKPEGKANGGPTFEYYGSDFESVRPAGQGSEFFLRPNGSGHDRFIRSYLECINVLICKHPAAVNVVHDFSL